jgi:hypothetical protein
VGAIDPRRAACRSPSDVLRPESWRAHSRTRQCEAPHEGTPRSRPRLRCYRWRGRTSRRADITEATREASGVAPTGSRGVEWTRPRVSDRTARSEARQVRPSVESELPLPCPTSGGIQEGRCQRRVERGERTLEPLLDRGRTPARLLGVVRTPPRRQGEKVHEQTSPREVRRSPMRLVFFASSCGGPSSTACYDLRDRPRRPID